MQSTGFVAPSWGGSGKVVCLPAVSSALVPTVHQLAGWWSDAPPHATTCVCVLPCAISDDAVPNANAPVCACCCVRVLPMSSATPPHQGTLLSRHCSIGPLEVVTGRATHSEVPNPSGGRLWGWRSLQHDTRGSSPCVSGYVRWGLCMVAVASPVFDAWCICLRMQDGGG